MGVFILWVKKQKCRVLPSWVHRARGHEALLGDLVVKVKMQCHLGVHGVADWNSGLQWEHNQSSQGFWLTCQQERMWRGGNTTLEVRCTSTGSRCFSFPRCAQLYSSGVPWWIHCRRLFPKSWAFTCGIKLRKPIVWMKWQHRFKFLWPQCWPGIPTQCV